MKTTVYAIRYTYKETGKTFISCVTYETKEAALERMVEILNNGDNKEILSLVTFITED